MNREWRSAIAMVAGIMLASSDDVVAQSVGSLSGRAYDAETRRPVQGLDVRMVSLPDSAIRLQPQR